MLSAPARVQAHENHEAVFMNTSLLRWPDGAQHCPAAAILLLMSPLPNHPEKFHDLANPHRDRLALRLRDFAIRFQPLRVAESR
jgi:hypothetical protein